MKLLSVNDVVVSFRKKRGLLGPARLHRVLDGVNLGMESGECLALVGESGSGKSTLGRCLIGLQKPDLGRVFFQGRDIYDPAENKDIPGKISVVFQDYTTSVNPFFNVREVIAEPLVARGRGGKGLEPYIVELLEQVGLNGDHLKRRPHQLSGGQLQRVCIARAIATRPSLILLDEAVSSLDVSVSVQILDLLLALKEKHGLSYFFITHDMTVVTYMCDRVLFFNQGWVVEEAPSLAALRDVRHRYSRSLLGAAASLDWIGDGCLEVEPDADDAAALNPAEASGRENGPDAQPQACPDAYPGACAKARPEACPPASRQGAPSAASRDAALADSADNRQGKAAAAPELAAKAVQAAPVSPAKARPGERQEIILQ